MGPILNEEAHLLTILFEEASEVLKDSLLGKDFSQEGNELVAVGEMLIERKILINQDIDQSERILNISAFHIALLDLIYYVSKSMRFSLKDYHPDNSITNQEMISLILFKLSTYIYLYKDMDRIDRNSLKEAKKKKVLKFMDYAREIGSLVD